MKKLSMFLAAGLSLGILACNDDADTADSSTADSTNSAIATDNTGTAGTASGTIDVPEGTRTTFETKYPQASNVQWRRYRRAEGENPQSSDWNYNLDTSDYEVSFRFNDMDYMAWYNDGNWLRSSTRVSDVASLPGKINDVIKKEYPGFTVVEVDKEEYGDGHQYEVELKKDTTNWKIHITPNGHITKRQPKKN